MRCDNCNYCKSGDCYETYWECSLGIEETENSKGQCGCRYNRKTLDKWRQEMLKAEAKECARMAACFNSLEPKGEKQ